MKLGCIVMASGHSTRFQENKLLYPLEGIPMARRVLTNLPRPLFSAAAVVSRSPEVLDIARDLHFLPVMNRDETNDTAHTIRLGLSALPEDLDGCLFAVCDQPWLRPETVEKLAEAFRRQPEHIVRLSWQGTPGNPLIFPRALFDELSNLPAHASGRWVLERHPELLIPVEALSGQELRDIDTKDDLQC